MPSATTEALVLRIDTLEREVSRLKRHRHFTIRSYPVTDEPSWGPYPPPPLR